MELREADVIIWDEASMSDINVFNCVDRLLRDVSYTLVLLRPIRLRITSLCPLEASLCFSVATGSS